MKKIILLSSAAVMLFFFTPSIEEAEAQGGTITCPSGDSYTCYERTDPDGSSYSVKKGPGDSKHTVIISAN